MFNVSLCLLLCSAPWGAFSLRGGKLQMIGVGCKRLRGRCPYIWESHILFNVSLCLLLCGCYVLLLGVRFPCVGENCK